MVSLAEWLAAARSRLEGVSDTPGLDAQVVLAHGLERPRSWILAHGESQLAQVQLEALGSALSRLQAGEPLPYVLGCWEFYGRLFQVSPAVLIPRPETELLVERALAWMHQPMAWMHQPMAWMHQPMAWTHQPLHQQPQSHTRENGRVGVDVGTGSGCIAITLAAELPGLRMIAADISARALEVAHNNALQLGVVERVLCVRSDLLPAGGPYDLVCANLPYIPTPTMSSLKVSRYEPHLALDGGPDGLVLIRRLLAQAPACLAPGAALFLEIEASQGQAARSLALASFPQAHVDLVKDLAGHDRLLAIYT